MTKQVKNDVSCGTRIAKLATVSLSRGVLRLHRSLRAFTRAPGLSFALLVTISLGVGANASVYGFLQGLTHPPSTLNGSESLVSVFAQDRSRDAGPISSDDYQLLKESRGIFEWIGAVRIEPNETRIIGQSEISTVAVVTPNLIPSLGVQLGNGAIISHRLWQNEFASNEHVVGSHLRIDGADFQVDAVAPNKLDGLYSGQSVDLWIQAKQQEMEPPHFKRDIWVLARLSHGLSISHAETALHSAFPALSEVSIAPYTGVAPRAARGLARVEMFLSFSAGAVFLIACINVASFLFGRAVRRSHETSLRIALGANRGEILLDLFADSIIISIAGGGTGLLLGLLTAQTLPAFLAGGDAQRISFTPHLLPIITASFVCVAVTVLCGMMPVLGTVTNRPWIVLKRETGSASQATKRLRSILVIGQITACYILILCTAFLLAGLHAALETNAGQKLNDPILLTVQATANPDVDLDYFSAVEQKAKSVSGLSPLTWTAKLPGNQPTWQTFKIEFPSSEHRKVAIDAAWLTPETLSSFECYPIAGKMFGLNDHKYKAAIVNEEAATKIFGLQTAGEIIQDPNGQSIEVIGVVRTKADAAKEPPRPTIYHGFKESGAPNPVRDTIFEVPVTAPLTGANLSTNVVSATYFKALGMPVLAGKAFPLAVTPHQGRIAVINQEAADLYFRGKPLGTAVISENGVRTEIIGVVRSQLLGTFEQHAEPAIYFPMQQDCPPHMTLMLKHSRWNSSIAAELQNKIQTVPGRGPFPIAINTLFDQLAQSGLSGLRIATLIGSVSTVSALILSILGLLNAQSDAEQQSQSDRALRIALGAGRWRIILLVVKSAAQLAAIGMILGTVLSFALLRLLMADIPVVTSPPINIWLIAMLLPFLVVMVASIFPAHHASTISPLTVMRGS